MGRSVDLLVFLELFLYLFVSFSLCLLLISLVFSLIVAQTPHLPARKKKKGVQGRRRWWKKRSWRGVCRGRNKYTVLAKSPSLGGLTWLQCQPHTRQVASQACSGPCQGSSTVQMRRPNAYFAARERAGYCCCWRHRGRLNPARAFFLLHMQSGFCLAPSPFSPSPPC